MPKTKKVTEVKTSEPLRPNQYFGLVSHQYSMFSAVTEPGLTEKELTDPKYWTLVASNFRPGSEIRCLAEDSSYIARIVVLFVNGSDVRVACESFTELDSVNADSFDADPEYSVKNGGVTGWYVMKKSTGERVLKNIPSQGEAFRQLAEYRKRLAA